MSDIQDKLSKRERQIMNIIYRLKHATALEVQESLPVSLSYSAVRTFLRKLEAKGMLTHKKEGNRYVFKPVIPKKKAMHSAVRQLLSTYFNNSVEDAVSAMISMDKDRMSKSDYAKLLDVIQKASEETEE